MLAARSRRRAADDAAVVVRLYERWLADGQRRAALLLPSRASRPACRRRGTAPLSARLADGPAVRSRPAPARDAVRARPGGAGHRLPRRRSGAASHCRAAAAARSSRRRATGSCGGRGARGRPRRGPRARRSPRAARRRATSGPSATLTEEVSHFLYVLFCARAERSVTQLELELQGEVDKYLSAVCSCALQDEGAVSPRLRELLFRRYRLARRPVGREGRALPRRPAASPSRYCALPGGAVPAARRLATWPARRGASTASASAKSSRRSRGYAPPRGARGARRKSAPGSPFVSVVRCPWSVSSS